MALPKAALTHAGGKSFIWRYEDGHAHRTEIETGVEDGEWIEVTQRRLETKSLGDKEEWAPIETTEQVLMGSKLSNPHRRRRGATGRGAGLGRGSSCNQGGRRAGGRRDDRREYRR